MNKFVHTVLWNLGRTFQFFALVTAGFALISGVNTPDPRRELMILLFGVGQFLLGYAIARSVRDKLSE